MVPFSRDKPTFSIAVLYPPSLVRYYSRQSNVQSLSRSKSQH
jgi:hypothetical protein